MVGKGPEDLLQKLPKHTPAWAVGLTSVAISFALCIASMYVVVRPEVQQYLQEGYKVEGKKVEAENTLTSSILGIVKANADQISTLSSALASAQESNTALTARVASIEKDLALTKASLEECQGRLRIRRG